MNTSNGFKLDYQDGPEVYGNVLDACLASGNSGYGIYMNHVNDDTVQNCTIETNAQGIYTVDALRLGVVGNQVTGSASTGIHLDGRCTGSWVRGNDVYANAGNGIDIANSGFCTVVYNQVRENGDQGIMLWGDTACWVVSNVVKSQAERGIVATNNSSGNVIANNLVQGNALNGIEFPWWGDGPGHDNVVERNEIRGNGTVNGCYQINVDGGSTCQVRWNDIIAAASGNNRIFTNTAGLDLTHNWWGTTDTGTVRTGISGDGSGTALYMPFRLGMIDTGVDADVNAPRAPAAVRASVLSVSTIRVSWTASTGNEAGGDTLTDLAGYRIYRSLVPETSCWALLGDVSATDTSYVDTGLTESTAYYYRVTAYDNHSPYPNESWYSDSTAAATATLDQSPPVVTIVTPAGNAIYIESRDTIGITYTVIDDVDDLPLATATLIAASDSTAVSVSNGQILDPEDIASGFWRLQVLASDASGNETEVATGLFEVVHDLQPPRTTLVVGAPHVTEPGDSETTIITSATPLTFESVDDLLTVGDSQGCGAVTTTFSLDGGLFTVGNSLFITETEGSHSLRYYSVDEHGFKEDTRTVALRLDLLAPAVALQIQGPHYTDNDSVVYGTLATNFTVIATDSVSGVDTCQLLVNGDTRAVADSFQFENNGSQSISWSIQDRLGHAASAERQIVLGDTEVSLSLSVDLKDSMGNVWIPEARVEIETVDTDNMPVSAIEWRVDTRDYQEYDQAFEIGDALDQYGDTGAGYGAHILTYRCTELVSNSSVESSVSFTLAPALVAGKQRLFAPRTLLWWNYDWTDETGTQAPPSEACRTLMESWVICAGMTLDTAASADSFMNGVRTGRSNLFIILGNYEALTSAAGAEVAERVNAGAGLLSGVLTRVPGLQLSEDTTLGVDSEARNNTLGVRTDGEYSDTDQMITWTTGQLLDTGSQLEVTESIPLVTAYFGDSLAVMSDSNAVIVSVFRHYGEGKALWLTFDPARLADGAQAETVARLVTAAMAAVTPETEPILTSGLIGAEMRARGMVVPSGLVVSMSDLLPDDLEIVKTVPPPINPGQEMVWTPQLHVGEETAVRYLATLPSEEDTYLIEGEISYLVRGTYRDFAEYDTSYRARSTGTNLELARVIVDSLVAQLPLNSDDRERAEAALATIEDHITYHPYTTPALRPAAVQALLEAIQSLLQIEEPTVHGDVARARSHLDAALMGYYWE